MNDPLVLSQQAFDAVTVVDAPPPAELVRVAPPGRAWRWLDAGGRWQHIAVVSGSSFGACTLVRPVDIDLSGTSIWTCSQGHVRAGYVQGRGGVAQCMTCLTAVTPTL